LISSEINVTPAGALTWAQDVFGNDVATVTFSAMTDVLAIDARAVPERVESGQIHKGGRI